jgi:3-deoxy-7-phosphoheptulonate synthase
MIESNFEAGKKSIPREGCQALKQDVSITDTCIDWQTTDQTLRRLAEVARVRRQGGIAL